LDTNDEHHRLHDLRCRCGSLVARLLDGKLELKCRRCQRIGVIDLAAARAAGGPIEIAWQAESPRATRR